MAVKEMTVTVIAYTQYNAEVVEDVTGFSPDDSEAYNRAMGGSHLAEFAGRSCYQSFIKPNPDTATNKGYLAHIMELQHESVMEHGSVTFHIQHVSRSLTHELIRHRHLSYSQESQRYVSLDGKVDPVVPPMFRPEWSDPEDPEESETEGIVRTLWESAIGAYDQLIDIWEGQLARKGVTGTERRKRVREAARCVLPNMTPTSIVVTGNHRAWRHFLHLRGSLAADAEIRDLAIRVFGWLRELEPNLYQDMTSDRTADGEMFITPAMDGL
jgi:thymidylate synthase (FAD)